MAAKDTTPRNQARREQILEAALALFSEKGYENTKVDEIAAKAGVNKALLYYHFENKEAVLRHFLEAFHEGVNRIAMDFVREKIIRPIQAGGLDILPDRLRFASRELLAAFMVDCGLYIEGVFDYALANRDVTRLMLARSLKRDGGPNGLFRFVEMMEQRESNPLYRAVWDADHDFTYSTQTMVSKFFFGILPLLNAAAYFDDYLRASALTEAELRLFFLQSAKHAGFYPVQGADLLLTVGGPLPL